jgi:hypothetical protein
VVILGQYRGTNVAVKRVLPPFIKCAGSKASLDTSDEITQQKRTNSNDNQNGRLSSKNSRAKARQRTYRSKRTNFHDDESPDLESGASMATRGHEKASASLSGSNNDWERLLNMRHVDNDTLRVLESATACRNGCDNFQGSTSQSQVILRYIPMFMRWDAQSTRIREFHSEMRLISRLRVCIVCFVLFETTVYPPTHIMVRFNKAPLHYHCHGSCCFKVGRSHVGPRVHGVRISVRLAAQ